MRHGIQITDYVADEWARFANAAYATGERNDLGHTFSAAAATLRGQLINCARYDALQDIYRAWLIGGFAAVDARLAKPAE